MLERGYEPRTIPGDIFNLYQSLGTIASIIHEFDEEEIFVNVATGSKVTAIAGMIAAMTNDATTYYVKAETYREGDVPRGIGNIRNLPRYPIDAPDRQHIEIVECLQRTERENVTKSNLIDLADEAQLSFVAERDVSRKAKYRLLDNHVITPLLNKGYITVSEEGRNRVISITDEGENLVEAFGYVIESEGDGGISTTLSSF